MWRACSVLVVLLPLLAACAPVPVTIAQNMLAATPTPTPDATPPPSGTPPIGVPPVVGTPRRVTPPSAPTVGAAATAVRGTAGTPATPLAPATPSAFFFRLDVRRTWTQPGAGGATAYFLEVAVCNQTQAARDVRLAALTVIVRPRGRPGAVGYGLKPEAAPEGGFGGAPIALPGACVGGVVVVTLAPTEIPDTLWYRSGDGREAADPVKLPFPD
jgi:hypothetical protein